MALNAQYMISPNLQEYFVDKNTGLPLSGGEVFYYSDISRSDLKTVYTLSGAPGSYSYTALPNPVTLSGVGTPTDGLGNDIRVYYYPYDSSGTLELYYIVVKDEDGVTQITRQAWPNVVAQDSDQVLFTYNFVRNPTFFSWSNTTVYSNVKMGSTNYTDFFADDWSYQQDDASQTINISRGEFLAGEDLIPTNPPYYLIYENANAGSALGTYNRFQQYYKSVQTLNSKNISVSIWVNQVVGAVASFSVDLTQYFGTGGSPSASVTTTVITRPSLVQNTWTEYKGTVLLPSVFGKIFGTNKDDALILSLNMPKNQTAKIYIGDVRLEEGLEITGTQEISNDDIQKNTNTISLYPPFTTGDVKFTLKIVADIGWAMMNNGTIGNPSSGSNQTGFLYYALFSLIWTNVHNLAFAPIYTSTGAPSTYGVSAKADWDANKRLALTKTLGQVFAGTAPNIPAAQNYTTSVASGTNLTVTDASVFGTGTPVYITGSPPVGLTIDILYYSIYVDATTMQLSNGINGSPIAFTPGVGSGTVNIIANELAYAIGEQEHVLTIPEIPSHNHTTAQSFTFEVEDASFPGSGVWASLNPAGDTGLTGGGGAHNNMQPTTYMNVMIKL